MADEVPSQPFWQTSSIIWGVGVVAGGIASIFVGLCRLHILCWAVTAEALTPLLMGIVTCYGGILWIYRRYRLGQDPNAPAVPRLTILPEKQERTADAERPEPTVPPPPATG